MYNHNYIYTCYIYRWHDYVSLCAVSLHWHVALVNDYLFIHLIKVYADISLSWICVCMNAWNVHILTIIFIHCAVGALLQFIDQLRRTTCIRFVPNTVKGHHLHRRCYSFIGWFGKMGNSVYAVGQWHCHCYHHWHCHLCTVLLVTCLIQVSSYLAYIGILPSLTHIE